MSRVEGKVGVQWSRVSGSRFGVNYGTTDFTLEGLGTLCLPGASAPQPLSFMIMLV